MANVKHHLLTAPKIKALAEPGTYTDGETLTIRVSDNGKKRWIQRISIHGKQHNLGLGGYPAVGLSEARQRAQDNLRAVREGRNPLKEKRDASQAIKKRSATPTFHELAMQAIDLRRPTWKGTKSAEQWTWSLRNFAFPVIGDKRVDEITTADITEILIPIWSEKEETSRRVRQRISNVMDLAIAKGWRNDNPAGTFITKGLPHQTHIVENFKALPYAEVPSAVETIRNSTADLVTKLALEFKILTAARTAEVRFADWSEIDLKKSLRTIPVADMKMRKMRRDFRIPLSDRATNILGEALELSSGTGLVFPNERTRKRGVPKPLSDAAFSTLMKRLGMDASPHGFRSSFKDWATEKQMGSDLPSEFALAHVEGGKAKRAYARTDLLETRRGLMQNWAHFCSTRETPAFQWEDFDLQKLSILS